MSHDDFDFLVANSEYFPPNTDFANIDLRKIRLSFPPGVQRDPQVLAKIEDIARKQVFLKDRFILQQLSDPFQSWVYFDSSQCSQRHSKGLYRYRHK